MTIDRLGELRHTAEAIGKIQFTEEKLTFCEGVSLGKLSAPEALEQLHHAWEDVRSLLPELYKLLEDYDRLRCIAKKAGIALLCDAPSSSNLLVPVDWWQTNG